MEIKISDDGRYVIVIHGDDKDDKSAFWMTVYEVYDEGYGHYYTRPTDHYRDDVPKPSTYIDDGDVKMCLHIIKLTKEQENKK